MLARIPRRRAAEPLPRLWLRRRIFVEGDEPAPMHQRMAATFDDASSTDIAAIQRDARSGRRPDTAALADDRAAHAEGLDRAEDGGRQAGRRHVALASGAARRAADNPEHLRCSRTGCAAIGRRSCSTRTASWCRRSAALAPQGERRMGANPHANGGLLLRDLRAAGLPRLWRRGDGARRESRPRRRGCSASSCAT